MDSDKYLEYLSKLEDICNADMAKIKETEQLNRLKSFQKQHTKLQKIRQDVLRYLVTTSGMMFSILVAFHKNAHNGEYTRWVFVIAVGLLAIGILLLSIALYGLLYNTHKVLELYAKADENNRLTTYREPRVFSFCQKVGLICLALAVICLVVFVITQALEL